MSVPDRIGRYDVVAPLATGGMAEILLGRLVGPQGFERPVVIKRILPHLARIGGFVAMFLDEARIVARIRHPNVVSVLELGQSDEELFLVLEYLEGESVGSLFRRLAAGGCALDPYLAAFVAAEACSGLHAAHELADDGGRDLDIVHRDVSPQNVFVTYDGRVVVLDFGIAQAKNRLTRTETGAMKGKLEYMSPEQCLGEPVDRRTDIFALGVVLYELTTGRRLFKRNGQLATLNAITREPPVRPSRLVSDYPKSLERICMRALERAPEDRYGTAAEMRRDLLLAMRELAPAEEADPSQALAKQMTTLFAERMREKQDLLRCVRAGTQPSVVPRNEDDDAFELGEASVRRGGGRVLRIVAAGALVAVGFGVFATLATRRFAGAPAVAARAASVAPSSSAAPEAPASAPSAGLASDVTLRIESRPAGARVSVAGVERGTTPAAVPVRRGSAPVAIELRRSGFVSIAQEVVPDVDRDILLVLEPKGRAPAAAAPKNREPPAAPSASAPVPFKRFE